MIDTEQMRKDADELLHRSDEWIQRGSHEASGLKRLPGLVKRVIEATAPEQSGAAVLRQVKASIMKVNLADILQSLGRVDGSAEAAIRAADQFLTDLSENGLIE